MNTIKAEAVKKSACAKGASRIQIVLEDKSGTRSTLDLSAAGAEELLHVLSDFCAAQKARAPRVTKCPRAFSVGSGSFERYVIVGFEDDVPYAVTPDMARDLAFAILDVSDDVMAVPQRLHN